MNASWILFIIGCVFAAALPQNNPITNAEDVEVSIINGKNAKLRQFPYIISVQREEKHWCGAAIISSRWLISAAHCYYYDDSKYVAVAGLLVQGDKNRRIQTIPIEKVIQHPNWDFTSNDLALLKLKKSLKFNKFVKPVDLPKSKKTPTGKVVVAGWGLINTNPIVSASTLQYLEMHMITNKECDKILKALKQPPAGDDKICTMPKKAQRSTCGGDSGGPLVKNNILVGVVRSGVDNSCTQNLSTPVPSIFTKVGLYLDFISEYVKS